MSNEPRYIGDGVYASFDGYQIWLRTERDGGLVHTIAIEPAVFISLIRYAQDLGWMKTNAIEQVQL